MEVVLLRLFGTAFFEEEDHMSCLFSVCSTSLVASVMLPLSNHVLVLKVKTLNTTSFSHLLHPFVLC